VKVVLFCGGMGTRLREHSETIPKPLVMVGNRPILWHLMRFYAHFGHKDFILCLGYRGDLIREYFLQYNECLSNDFTLSEGGARIDLHSSDIAEWRITFVDTGLHATLAQRLQRVRPYLENESVFLANYADGLSDVPVDLTIQHLEQTGAYASLVGVSNLESFHAIETDGAGLATRIEGLAARDLMINGGFFVLRPQVFDYIEPGDELVERPFQRLIEQRRLAVYRHTGFWRAMDTLRDKIALDRMEAKGDCPWMLWKG
jgi:glucose-1-phosphate cytidylyltransferase